MECALKKEEVQDVRDENRAISIDFHTHLSDLNCCKNVGPEVDKQLNMLLRLV